MTNQEIISQAYNSLSGKWLKTLFPFFIVALIPNLYQPSVNYSPPIYLAFILKITLKNPTITPFSGQKLF